MILDKGIDQYLSDLQSARDPLVAELERRAAREEFPIVGPQVGQLLSLLTAISGARRVLELGSGFGYSAIWFARALPDDGRIVLTDLDQGQIDDAKAYLERAGVEQKAEYHQGDALKIAAGLSGPFDIIFNDVDKEAYPQVVGLALELLAPNGLLITDNALWYGKPADPANREAATEGVRDYNEAIMAHPRLQSVILPVRDGVAVSRLR